MLSLSLSDFLISILQLEETSSRTCAASLVDSKIKNKVLRRRYSSIGEDSLETMMKLVKHLGDPIRKLIGHNESIVVTSLDNLKRSLPQNRFNLGWLEKAAKNVYSQSLYVKTKEIVAKLAEVKRNKRAIESDVKDELHPSLKDLLN